jgi:glutamyl-tRNA reductase
MKIIPFDKNCMISPMALMLIGADYRDISLSDLNKLEKSVHHLYKALKSKEARNSGISAGVILSTCNRFEVYIDSSKFHSAIEFLVTEISRLAQDEEAKFKELLRISYDDAVVTHLFSVASGLKSMIIGESEIAGQVKRALEVARENNSTNKEIESLFQYCSRVSKQVATETGIGTTGKNMISVALDIAKNHNKNLRTSKVLVIGTGAYARVVVNDLKANHDMTIFNYSESDRAKEFSESLDIKPIDKNDLYNCIGDVDVIISCSGSNQPIINQRIMIEANHKNPIIIDLSLNTDIDDDVKELIGVNVIDINTIKNFAPDIHNISLSAASEIVTFHSNKFVDLASSKKLDSVVGAMHDHINRLIVEEVSNVRKKSGDTIALEVEKSLFRLAHSMLHTPSVKAREVSRDGDESDYRKAVKLLFNIDANTFER